METLRQLLGCKQECCAKTEKQDVVVPEARGDNNDTGLKLDSLPGPSSVQSLPSRDAKDPEADALACSRLLAPRISTVQPIPSDGWPTVDRLMVGGGNDRDVEVHPPSPKTLEETQLLVNAVKKNKNLQAVLTLEDKLCNDMVEMAWKETFLPGTEITTQGDLNGDYFYIVQDGELDVMINDRRAYTAKRGDSFGEIALLYFAPRSRTVKSVTPVVLWVVDRCHFKAILAKSAEHHLATYAKHLHTIERCEKLAKKIRLEVANAMEEMHYVYGNTVYSTGDRGNRLFFIFEGEVAIMQNGVEKDRQKGERHHPVILGEKALSESAPRRETVVVKSATATGVTLDRETFDLLMYKVKLERENKKKLKEGLPVQKFGTMEYCTDDWKMKHRNHIRLKDIRVVGALGAGAFGLVELVEHMPTRETYALKTISKGHIMKCGHQSSIQYEKNCQFMCDSPFIVKLVDTYVTSDSISFMQEAMLGGDLMTLYTRKKIWSKDAETRYYCAAITLALEHMHDKCIIYRDLKPENVLIDENGLPKITDMGLAKLSAGKTYTTCGALISMSPEVIKCTGHNRGTDWWTLGVLIYELMAKDIPFDGESTAEIYGKIFAGMDKAQFKECMQGDCEDLVKALCRQLVFMRLPMTPGGVENLKQHSWYRGFDWTSLLNLTMKPPYTPIVRGKCDTANFMMNFKVEIPMACTYKDDNSGWDKEFATSW